MNRDLTRSERRVLRDIKAKLRCQVRYSRKLTDTERRVLAWCHEQDLLATVPIQVQEYSYTLTLLHAIEQRLALLGLAPLGADLSGSSLAQAAQGAAEHKSGRSQPREHRVLRAAGGLILDQDQRELALESFSEIILVENLDCFYQLTRFHLPVLPSSLVIYRGDSLYSTGRAQLLKRWREGGYGPRKYFGDLDPKGLHMASSEGFTHLAVPELDWFCQQASEQAYPSKQHSLTAQLRVSEELQPYLSFIQRHQRALLQQWLQDVALHWVLV
ncbi:DUF7281 domain-containing protein [Thiopseudomonas acetoxidans]|uniref:DUF7281 domain-containing protein n=1 Tax=Thiopseudomonas acetoxidans TaxID=3041622 RepID=A0ABT7SQX5_9GAMM|nr:hypothetical protein [Thiopseudomonas sp. CY1220]MDM7858598.1 hypothetical protein [Thiopseudomonas sp. CY1220]